MTEGQILTFRCVGGPLDGQTLRFHVPKDQPIRVDIPGATYGSICAERGLPPGETVRSWFLVPSAPWPPADDTMSEVRRLALFHS